ncbi:AMP-binding protein [Nesterenkonia lacusekhoensis]|uniref:Acyl-CoA synthetase (AMP-forming)/AMP-acid ligase II n=1 Tax=Nesterenkonia lacusekhoensis TaxID=150832 RepID=A0ABS4T0P0_9MICC|nr:AMP-binding protein [Nesterenkonia lacusekhoensis]MBP2318012.1 acyl-CoA synthetase (AMP-forming)/AMP-acid ligase II [Nesterenkonia lacusekhoensis]
MAVITSPHTSIEIPDLSLYDLLFGSLSDEDAARTALVQGETGRAVSYGALKQQVDQLAGALSARGIGPGSVVALQAPNLPEFVTAFHGILRSGATATTVNSLYTASEVARQLRASGATMMITVSALAQNAVAGAEEAGFSTERIIMLDEDGIHPSLLTLLGEEHEAPDPQIDPAEHVAVLPYSSGTTGVPKGVMLTHRNLVANTLQLEGLLPVDPGAPIQAVLPMFHIYGLTVLMNFGLHRRAEIVTMAKFDLSEFLRIIQDHQIRVSFIAPPIAVALAKHPMVDDYDTDSLISMLCGAAPLDESTASAVSRRLGADLRQGFGMTELSPVSHLAPYGDDRNPLGSIGPAVANVECRVVDPATGEDVELPQEGESAPGEMWTRGPLVMKGYLNNEEATVATITEDGWLRTGDIVTYNAGGWFTAVDRLKELIKYKGYQVPPAELEAVLLEHDQITDAAVIGVPDEEGGEAPKAFVVVRQDAQEQPAQLSGKEVMEYMASRVAPHKKIRYVEFIDEVPKSRTGKILRRELKARTAPAAAA